MNYQTLKTYGEAEIIIKKSRFIGRAKPVETEEEAIAFIQGLRKKYPEATHHCYAYIIGKNSGIMRYSDDGEPSGTAGIPILEVLKMRQVVNAVVVVTRFFGGVLLGAGGLVRAYTQGCVEAIKGAQVVVMEKSLTMAMDVPYSLWDKVQYEMGRQRVQIQQVNYAEQVECTFLIREEDLPAFAKVLANWTEGKVEAVALEEGFEPWELMEIEEG